MFRVGEAAFVAASIAAFVLLFLPPFFLFWRFIAFLCGAC